MFQILFLYIMFLYISIVAEFYGYRGYRASRVLIVHSPAFSGEPSHVIIANR